MAIELLVSKSERIIKSLPDDNSKDARYVHEHSEEIIETINKYIQQGKREININQFKAHQEAKNIILY